jgi:hypothetical protein
VIAQLVGHVLYCICPLAQVPGGISTESTAKSPRYSGDSN